MTKVNFFTPITFGDLPKSSEEKAIETYDSYFNIFGWSAKVIDKDTLEAELHYEKPKFLISAFKVISYLTLIIPIIVLGLKYASRAGYNLTFKEVSTQPDIDVEEEDPELKVRRAVSSFLKLNKFEDAKQLLTTGTEAFIEELKLRVKSEEEKYTLLKAIDECRFDTVQRLLHEMETSDDKDEILEKAILKLINSDPERALEINGETYSFKSNQIRHKFKIVQALIQKGYPFADHLNTLPISKEKDDLLKLAIKKGVEESNVNVLDLFKEPFKDYKVKLLLINEALHLLNESNAKKFIDILKIPVTHDQDDLIIETMEAICVKKAFDAARAGLLLNCRSPYKKMALHELLATALINDDKKDEGLAVIKAVYSHMAAKDTIIHVITVLKDKELYSDIVDLITNNSSIYKSDYLAAFASSESKNEICNRVEIAKMLLEKGLSKLSLEIIKPLLSMNLHLVGTSIREIIEQMIGKEFYFEAIYLLCSYQFMDLKEFVSILKIIAIKFNLAFDLKSKSLEMDLRKAISIQLETLELKESAKQIYPF